MFCSWIVRYPNCTKYVLTNSWEVLADILRYYPEGKLNFFESHWEAADYLQRNLTDYELYKGSGRQYATEININFIYTI